LSERLPRLFASPLDALLSGQPRSHLRRAAAYPIAPRARCRTPACSAGRPVLTKIHIF